MSFLGIVYDTRYEFMTTIRIAKIVKNRDFLSFKWLQMKKYLIKGQKKLWELLISCDD